MANETGVLCIGGPLDGKLWFGTLHTLLNAHKPLPPITWKDYDKVDDLRVTAAEYFTYRLAAYRHHHLEEVIRVYVPHDMKDPDIVAAVIKSYHARALKETREQQAKVPR